MKIMDFVIKISIYFAFSPKELNSFEFLSHKLDATKLFIVPRDTQFVFFLTIPLEDTDHTENSYHNPYVVRKSIGWRVQTDCMFAVYKLNCTCAIR